MKIFKWIAIIVLMLALSIPMLPAGAAPRQAVGTGTFSLNGFNPASPLVGDDIAFNLSISLAGITAPDPGVSGAEIYLTYDPAYVIPATTPTGQAYVETVSDFFGVSAVTIVEALPAASCPGATLPCLYVVLAGPPQLDKSAAIAVRFHFIGQAATDDTCFTGVNGVLANADGFDVPATDPSPLCTDIQEPGVNGIVLRQGIVHLTSPAVPAAGVGSDQCSLVTASALSDYTDYYGAFNLTGSLSSPVTITASYPGYLNSSTSLTLTGITTTTCTTTLKGGDVIHDGAVNILDIGKIISMFGKTTSSIPPVVIGSSSAATCGVTVDTPEDINDDGSVNVGDLAIAAGNWGKTVASADVVWPTVCP